MSEASPPNIEELPLSLSARWLVDGKRATRIAALLICIVALVLGAFGTTLRVVGSRGMARYERTGGRLARLVSSSDRRYYQQLSTAQTIGTVFLVAAALILCLGSLLLVSPRLVLRLPGFPPKSGAHATCSPIDLHAEHSRQRGIPP